MAKLTNQHRDEIRDILIGDQFDKRRDALRQAYGNLAISIYNDVVGNEKERLYQSPSHWFEWKTEVNPKLGGDVTVLEFGDGTSRPFPASLLHGVVKHYPGDHVFTEEYRRIKSNYKKVKEEERQLTAEINAVLWHCNTDNQLVEAWPQISHIVKRVVEQKSKKQVPAQQIEQLNAKLELQGT